MRLCLAQVSRKFGGGRGFRRELTAWAQPGSVAGISEDG